MLLGEILLATPPDAMDTVANRFAVARYRQGALPKSYRLPHINPLTQQRILAHASTHTGIDIATITAPACGVPRPPAVANARLLTAALLHEVALAPAPVIASIVKAAAGRLGDNTRAYRATIAKSPALAADFKQLTRQIEDLSKPAPTPPTLPHHQRMLGIASAIRPAPSTSSRPRTGLSWRSAPAWPSAKRTPTFPGPRSQPFTTARPHARRTRGKAPPTTLASALTSATGMHSSSITRACYSSRPATRTSTSLPGSPPEGKPPPEQCRVQLRTQWETSPSGNNLSDLAAVPAARTLTGGSKVASCRQPADFPCQPKPALCRARLSTFPIADRSGRGVAVTDRCIRSGPAVSGVTWSRGRPCRVGLRR